MKKWSKRFFVAALVLALVFVGLGVTGWVLKGRRPDWYPSKVLSPEELKQASHSMQGKLIGFQDWAAGVNAADRTHASGRAPVPTDPTTAPSRVRSISFTEAELNAFFNQWDTKWEDKYNQYVTDPILVLQDDRIILAANVPEAGTLVSVHLAPKLDDAGKLHLDIDKVMGGVLPVPRAFYEKYRNKLSTVLTARVNRERGNATLNADGSVNLSLITASMNELLVHALNGEPAEPILYLPHDVTNRKVGLPVKLTDIKIKDKTISFTVVPLTPEERKELVGHIHDGDAPKPQAVTAAR
jgi:hypothetical protein